MLKIRNLNAYYGDMQALFGVNIEVKAGNIVSIVGANGAGKSTLLRAISGLIPRCTGSIEYKNTEIKDVPAHMRVHQGLVQVLEGRRLFPFMTVYENLELGCYNPRARKHKEETLEYVFSLFPRLKERAHQLAGSLSGGEQQMCAIGRGLMAKPEILMLDEPTLGLAPILVQEVFERIREINNNGITILLVEQNAKKALEVADYGYVIGNGQIMLEGPGKELVQDKELQKAVLNI